MKFLHKLYSWITGKNLASTPKALIKDQLSEQRPLPLGMAEFMTWSDRIIAGACLTAKPDDQRYALAGMLMHLKPTDDHCDDGYFIKSLRKVAANQIAHAFMTEHYEKIKKVEKAIKAAETDPAPVVGRIVAHTMKEPPKTIT